MDSDTVAVARPVAAPAANPNQREPVRGVARPDFAHMVPYNPLPSSSKYKGPNSKIWSA